jgi:phage tail tape-measure protein
MPLFLDLTLVGDVEGFVVGAEGAIVGPSVGARVGTSVGVIVGRWEGMAVGICRPSPGRGNAEGPGGR